MAGARSIEPFQVSGWRGDREAMGFQCFGSMRTRKDGCCELGTLGGARAENVRMRRVVFDRTLQLGKRKSLSAHADTLPAGTRRGVIGMSELTRR